MPGFLVGPLGGGRAASNASGRVNAYYSYTWELTSIFVALGDQAGNSARYFPSSFNPLIYLKEASLPTMSVSKEVYQGASVEYKYGKSVNWEDIRLVWYDTEGLVDIVKEWRRRIWTEEDGLKASSSYKSDTVLTTYLPTGLAAVKWKLIGSWPSIIRYGELTYASSDAKYIDVTVTYDYADEKAQ